MRTEFGSTLGPVLKKTDVGSIAACIDHKLVRVIAERTELNPSSRVGRGLWRLHPK